jgi:hypothetical protein
MSRLTFVLVGCILQVSFSSGALGQMSAEEHASHHPGAGATPAPMPAGGMGPPADVGPPGGTSGMGGMGKMMEGMGKPPPKDVYPSLMAIPEFTPEKRTEVAAQADARMHSGIAAMAAALDRLNQGIADDNFVAMQDATAEMRLGLTEFDSGVAGRRALAEGKAPRDVGLQWFRSEMSLPQPGSPTAAAQGLSWFHVSVMALLILFALAMLAMYFFKMRRAAALFGRLDPDKGSPPPGSAPPLG